MFKKELYIYTTCCFRGRLVGYSRFGRFYRFPALPGGIFFKPTVTGKK